MTHDEKVTLAMLVTIGATALDSPAADDKRRMFEAKFGARIEEKTIIDIINRVGRMIGGSEEIVIDD